MYGRVMSRYRGARRFEKVVAGVSDRSLAELEGERQRLTRELLDPLPAGQRNAALAAMHTIADRGSLERSLPPAPTGPLPPGWVEANEDTLSRWAGTSAAMEAREAALVRTAAERQPEHLARLGPVPEDRRGREQWERGARAVETFRDRHGVVGPDPLGSRPDDVVVRRDWERARGEFDRAVRSLGREGPGLGR